MKPWLIALALAQAACAPPQPTVSMQKIPDDQIVAALNARLGEAADAKGGDRYARASRKLDFLVRTRVAGKHIACGYTGYSSPGVPIPSSDRRVFILRGRSLIIEGDVSPSTFRKLQDELCGPDWVLPSQLSSVGR